MADDALSRKLATIVALDVAGYSARTEADEAGTAAAIAALRRVIEGIAAAHGGRVRITVHLVEAASHATLWSDRFDGSLDDIFAVQDEISEQIAAALHHAFKSFSTKAIDPAAYDLYLRASPRSCAPSLRSSSSFLPSAVSSSSTRPSSACGGSPT